MSQEGFVFPQRQEVIDKDCVRHTKSVEVHAIDASLSLQVIVVEEELLDAPWEFSEGSGSSHDPTVTDGALAHITGRDTFVSEKRHLGEFLGDSGPFKN